MYLNESKSGQGFTAKDFRTWGANCVALKKAPRANEICRDNPRKKLETTLIKLVAEEMPNEFSFSKNTNSPEERWLRDIPG